MAPPLKPNPIRRNLKSTKATVDAAQATKPKLTDAVRSPAKMTTYWWDVIWSSPISHEWVDADVPELLALAQLVDDFWTSVPEERSKRHAEMRMAMTQFGLTPYSRRQLQWEVRRVEGAKPPAPPSRRRSSAGTLSILTSKAG